MHDAFRLYAQGELTAAAAAGLDRRERLLASPQGGHVMIGTTRYLNLCSNDYLGLSHHPDVIAAAHQSLDRWGYGLSSVRFICGTQELHKTLEARISAFLRTEDTILYSSCFDANGGIFETILGPDDAVISDALNHASIIDGIRLCKAKRLRYANRDSRDLERCLRESADARFRLIVTDGVFSMTGAIADLPNLCALAREHQALVMIDDSHAAGVLGQQGRGTPEHCQVEGQIDLITGTLGKALGGASGGYASGRKEIIGLLRQRSRPYLFSNTLAPCIAAASITAIDLAEAATSARRTLLDNAAFVRAALTSSGFTVLPSEHPIIPVMLRDAGLAVRFAEALYARGIYVVGFGFPVVERDQARIRCQISAAHTRADLEVAITAFRAVAGDMGMPQSR